MMADEKDDKGYYSAEKITLTQNKFDKQNGMLLDIYRGGNDESTMGPILTFSSNKVTNSKSEEPFIHLYGVQRSFIEKNTFANCNTGSALIRFEDAVRAMHQFKNNQLKQSGSVSTNKFVQSQGNIVQ